MSVENIKLPVKPVDILYVINNEIEEGFSYVKSGKFSVALYYFRNSLQKLSLSIDDIEKTSQMIYLCRTYCLAMEIGVKSNEIRKNDPKRHLELSLMMSMLNMNTEHHILAAQTALNTCIRMKCNLSASNLLKFLPDEVRNSSQFEKARSVLSKSELNDSLDVDFSPKKEICCSSLKYIQSTKKVICPFCKSTFSQDEKGNLCSICQLSEIGKISLGMK